MPKDKVAFPASLSGFSNFEPNHQALRNPSSLMEVFLMKTLFRGNIEPVLLSLSLSLFLSLSLTHTHTHTDTPHSHTIIVTTETGGNFER